MYMQCLWIPERAEESLELGLQTVHQADAGNQIWVLWGKKNKTKQTSTLTAESPPKPHDKKVFLLVVVGFFFFCLFIFLKKNFWSRGCSFLVLCSLLQKYTHILIYTDISMCVSKTYICLYSTCIYRHTDIGRP